MSRLQGAPLGLPAWAPACSEAGQAWEQWARRAAALPFDALRAQYAAAVRGGVMPASLLDASRFERGVAQWEKALLGAWARAR